MKKLMTMIAVLGITLSAFSGNNDKKEDTKTIDLDRDAFIEKVFDYQGTKEWSYAGDKPAIIDFWAAWCGPCRQIAPVLAQIAAEYEGEIYVYKVNVDEQREVARAFGIRNIPTLLFVPMEGKPQAVMGAASKSKIKNSVETILFPKEEE